MDYIDTLRIFCSVVDARSFSRAADMLDLSSPTVSRAIAALEQRLGVRLFNRTTRQLSLTGAAERFYDGCVGVLSDLKALEEGASNAAREPIGVLRLVAHTTAAAYWLVPLVASYKQKHPQIGVDVTLTERPVDLVAEGYDVGLVVPFMLMSDSVITRLIKRIAFTIVASPDYLRRHPAPAHPSELAEHKIIASASTIRKPELT
ncbi:MAG TPA: LysR family transcriptional regulator, partial [Acidocella sp.]|nr:LysR family transcriptional regulator [Acidocella sp.]